MATTIEQKAAKVAALLEDRLKIRGKDLQQKLRRGGRMLPSKVRKEALYLAHVAAMARHPKVQMMIDEDRAARAYEVCLKHLNKLGSKERAISRLIGIGGSIAFALLFVAAAFVAILVWRGFV